MKKIINIFLLFAIGFASCKKDEIVQTDKQVGSSKITYYAIVTVTGNQYMSIVKGGTFTDPGATATVNGKSNPVTVSGSVNTAVPGLYILTYSSTNEDGYSASQTRTVAVLPAAESATSDISGSYSYVANSAYSNTITKLAPGLYLCSNVWGASTIPALFVCVDGANINIYGQNSPFGALTATTATLSSTGSLKITVTIPSQGITNAVRSWQKQ